MTEPFPKPTRWESAKYRLAAKGQNCTMRLPGCQNDTATVVLAHRNGVGMGTKSSDHDAADLCAHCHNILDGRTPLPRGWSQQSLTEYFDRARLKTILNRIERGIIK